MTEQSKEKDTSKMPEEIDIKQVLLLFASIVKVTGEFMISVGKVTSKRGDMSKFSDLVSSQKELWTQKLLSDIPEDKLGPVIKILFKIGSPPDFSKILSEPSEEVITKGKEYISLATKLESLLEVE